MTAFYMRRTRYRAKFGYNIRMTGIALATLFLIFVLISIYGHYHAAANIPEGAERMIFYRRKDYFLSRAEKAFFHVLQPLAAEHECIVFAKVRLEDIVWVAPYVRNRFVLRNRIKSRHVDFVLCRVKDVQPILAIELDDSSHESFRANVSDVVKNEILMQAGMPLLRVRASHQYDAEALSREIEEKVKTSSTSDAV
jgi:very-short-patch-repair endonuclease